MSRSERESLSLRLPAVADHLHTVRSFLESVLGAWFGDRGEGDEAQELLLAVQEGMTNVVRHAYRMEGGLLEIEISRNGGAAEVVLRDWGVPFDPTRVPPPDFDRPQEGGYGLYIMRTVTDGCVFERAGGENLLFLRKHILAPAPVRTG